MIVRNFNFKECLSFQIVIPSEAVLNDLVHFRLSLFAYSLYLTEGLDFLFCDVDFHFLQNTVMEGNRLKITRVFLTIIFPEVFIACSNVM